MSADASTTGLVRLLDQAAQFRGYPRAIRTDYGPEFTSRAFLAWTAARGVRRLRKFRDECMNGQWIESLTQARQEITRWRWDHNEVRPHSSLERIPPASFAARHRQRAGDVVQSPEIK